MRIAMMIGVGVAAVVVAAAVSRSDPQRVPSKGKKGPKVGDLDDAAGPVISQGDATLPYASDLVAIDEAPLPKIKMGKGLLAYVSGVVDKLLSIVAKGDPHPFYPGAWTEGEAQIDELAAVTVPIGSRVDVGVILTIESAWGEDDPWFQCRELVFDGRGLNATQVLYPDSDESLEPKDDPGSKWIGRVPCLYAARKYQAAGLKTKIVPRPGAPDWHVAIGVEPFAEGLQRVAVYVYTPPRLGTIRTQANWTIRSS